MWQPSATLEMLRDRALLLSQIRSFFSDRNVLEVDTPALSSAANPDSAIESIRAVLNANAAGKEKSPPFYLHTSPEFFMKRLLAAGTGSIYQISHVFRDAEIGRYHNPEFSMLEWYRTCFDMFQLIGEVEELMRTLFPEQQTPVIRISYHELFERCTGVDLRLASESDIRQLAGRFGVVLPEKNPEEGLVEILFDLSTTSWMKDHQGVIVYNFPSSQASLAMVSPDDPSIALRFEYYYRGIELANGFQELADATEQRRRFGVENNKRHMSGNTPMPVDEHFLAALEHGLPDCSGVAAGIDRILMMRNNQSDLESVLAFPVSRA